MMNSVAPFLIFYIGALAASMTRGSVRSAVMLAVPLIGAYNLFTMTPDADISFAIFDYTLDLLAIDRQASMMDGHGGLAAGDFFPTLLSVP